jgi:predicted PurR-regulated permease PerM
MTFTENKKNQLIFISVALIGSFLLVFSILRPFIYTLILAVIFAVVFQRPYEKALKLTKQNSGLASFLVTLLVILIVIIPLTFLGKQIIQEGQQLYFSLTENGSSGIINSSLESIKGSLNGFLPGVENISIDLDQYIKTGISWVLQNLTGFFSNVVKTLVNAFIFLIAFYYLLKEGRNFKSYVVKFSPLNSEHNEVVLSKLDLAINSVVKGNIIIALVQGVLTSIGLSIFGVPNPVIWGVLAAVSALIPGVGTSIVIIPAIIYLFFTNAFTSALGLIIWGIIAVGMIDNFLGPKLVGKGMKLHPLLVILAVFGGATFFGPIGFLLGPLSLSLFLALLDIYSIFLKHNA